MSLRAFLAIAGITYGALFFCSTPSDPPDPQPAPIPSTVYVPMTTPTTPKKSSTPASTSPQVTTTFAPIVFPDTPCQEFAPLAVEAGWPADPFILDRLLTIMFRESRCTPSATSPDDDRGLLQIHSRSWCQPNRYNSIGWLQAQGIIVSCDDLYDPLLNLRSARALYLYSEARGDAWRPWALTR